MRRDLPAWAVVALAAVGVVLGQILYSHVIGSAWRALLNELLWGSLGG